MYLTVTIYLKTNKEDEYILNKYSQAFHHEIEKIIMYFKEKEQIVFYPYRNVSEKISFYSKNQVIHFAEFLFTKRALNQNLKFNSVFSLSAKSFSITKDELIIYFGKKFYLKDLKLKVCLQLQQQERLTSSEILKLDIKKHRNCFYAKVLCKILPKSNVKNENGMGVDVGMRCPAVCYTHLGKVKFCGNGRQIRFQNRVHQAYIKKNHLNTKKMETFDHKSKNYKVFIDHCISKEVIKFAKEQNVSFIKLEDLSRIQNKFKNHDQMIWSYYRLLKFIEYKAKLEGIFIIYVDPFLTSKKCPKCGKINNVKNRQYICNCGFQKHRDIVGAMNILSSTKIRK